jgi:hypothetical protein
MLCSQKHNLVNTSGEVTRTSPKHMARIQYLECWQTGTQTVPVTASQVPRQSHGIL